MASAQTLGGMVQLLRVKPVLSWGVAAFLIGVAIAYARVGQSIDLVHGALALVMVVLAQGVVSHGLNDAYDWITGTDKESIGKGTGGSRVIPQGKMTVTGVILAAIAGLAVVLAIAAYFIQVYGVPMIVLAAVAVWSPVAYSVPPLKLGYRPFNELAVVLPAITGVVVGTDLVLTGSWSYAALGAGLVHSMFCIHWFIISRVPDYEPDKRVGKVTSVVYVGRENATLLSASYLALAVALVPLLATEISLAFFVAAPAWAWMMLGLSKLDPYDPTRASEIRLRNMHSTTAHAIAFAAAIVVFGV